MSKVLSEFKDSAIKHNRMSLFSAEKGMEVIDRCKQLNREIYGIDAFILRENTIQPFIDYSIDYSRESDRINRNYYGNWEAAKAFLEKFVNTNFVFEIFFDGYADE
jgi:hypothetical protein